MPDPDELGVNKEPPRLPSTRLEEARRIIEEYADALRELIKKLRRKMN
jgi:hypothetical protein